MVEIEAALLTGGQDPHYAFGLAMALISRGVSLDVIGSDEVDISEFHSNPRVKFLNLRGDQRANAGLVEKVTRVLRYYLRLVGYAARARPKLFHILWNNRLEIFDRTLLLLYYKLLGKKIVFTAHNVNLARRDGIDSWFNRLTLRMQYQLVDHIFVHTEKMKSELHNEFGAAEDSITVIPFGINNAVPDTDLTSAAAKNVLGIKAGERTIMFFGAIAPYKGLDLMVEALQKISTAGANYRLIIAGKPKGGCEDYLREIKHAIASACAPGQVIMKTEYIADPEIEVYFKAADVLVLPYREIFQSGVLFLGQRFGLPVIAADVGSFRDDIIEGKTGFLCRPGDPADLAQTIEMYFQSDLYKELGTRRQEIRERSNVSHSWEVVGELTQIVYAELLEKAQ